MESKASKANQDREGYRDYQVSLDFRVFPGNKAIRVSKAIEDRQGFKEYRDHKEYRDRKENRDRRDLKALELMEILGQ